MLIKTFIFYGYKGVCKVFWNHVLSYRNTIGILRDQLGSLISLKIVNKGGKTGGGNGNIFDAGWSVNYALENTDAHADADNAYCQYAKQGKV